MLSLRWKAKPKSHWPLPGIVRFRVNITFLQWFMFWHWWFATHNKREVPCTITFSLLFIDDSLKMHTLLIAVLGMLQQGLHVLSCSFQATDWFQSVRHSPWLNYPCTLLRLMNFGPCTNKIKITLTLWNQLVRMWDMTSDVPGSSLQFWPQSLIRTHGSTWH